MLADEEYEMSSEVGACGVVHVEHRGWLAVQCSPKKINQLFGNDGYHVVSTQERLNELVKKSFNLWPLPPSLASLGVDFEEKDLVFIRCIGEGPHFGVKRIEETAEKVHVHVCSFSIPDSMSSHGGSSGIKILVLEAAKKTSFVVDYAPINLEEEPEVASIVAEKKAVEEKLGARLSGVDYYLDLEVHNGSKGKEEKRKSWYKPTDWYKALDATKRKLVPGRLPLREQWWALNEAKGKAATAAKVRLQKADLSK